MHIRDLRRIRHMLDLKTASTIATSIVHAKLDYCNSLFLNRDITQINRLQAIQNALACAATKTPKHHHITPVLKTLHWLKIPERIEYKVIILTYNTLQSSQPSYLGQLFAIQQPRSTRSSSTLTLLRPSVTSSLKFSNRSIAIAVPPLWNKLPPVLRQISDLCYTNELKSLRLPLPSIQSPQLFHSKLKDFSLANPILIHHLPRTSLPASTPNTKFYVRPIQACSAQQLPVHLLKKPDRSCDFKSRKLGVKSSPDGGVKSLSSSPSRHNSRVK